MSGHRIFKYNSEQVVHEEVILFMRREYPGIIWRTDFAAGIKLPAWLAARQKRLQCGRGFPDIMIFEPVRREGMEMYHGLALELKAKDIKIKLNDGRWASDVIKNQYRMLKRLNDRGYATAFARGLDEACAVIRWYLDGTEDIEFNDFIPTITLGDVKNIDDPF